MKRSALLSIVLVLAAVACLLFSPPAGAADSAPGEYQVKAALLYNFLPFVEWPPARSSSTLRICLLGDQSGAFDELHGQGISNRKIEIVHVLSLSDIPRCDVLFIGVDERQNIPKILKALRGTNVLSIAEASGLAQQGIVINFYLERKKVRFEINAEAARQAGLTVSSKLLKLAGAVYYAVPTENQ